MLLYKGKDFLVCYIRVYLNPCLLYLFFFCGNINAIQNRNRNEMMMKKNKEKVVGINKCCFGKFRCLLITVPRLIRSQVL